MSTIAKLEEIGFLGPRLVAAHSTILDDAELEALARTGTKVSYNPVSNCYCGVGVAPIVPMLELGIDVSVAVDGASVNCQNMLESLKFGALLQKAYYGDAMAINARDMLKLATVGGANALGAPDLLGALEVGRLADFFLFDPAHLTTTPVHDPISAVVYAGDAAERRHGRRRRRACCSTRAVHARRRGGADPGDAGAGDRLLDPHRRRRASSRTGGFTPFRDYERSATDGRCSACTARCRRGRTGTHRRGGHGRMSTPGAEVGDGRHA